MKHLQRKVTFLLAKGARRLAGTTRPKHQLDQMVSVLFLIGRDQFLKCFIYKNTGQIYLLEFNMASPFVLEDRLSDQLLKLVIGEDGQLGHDLLCMLRPGQSDKGTACHRS